MITKEERVLHVTTQLGLSSFLLESDAPHLLPMGCIGPNHPWNMWYVAEALAGAFRCPVEEVLRITRLSFYELYGLPWV